ncbi:uncharacterized protein J3D65DRAFT_450968 [Phyllosticta citribraziliensis]|uniref:Uncharacterized protein n=1 Tax=Phyllosticta citribraziliensis TaxID=989973 RepID=A0ABR1LJH9_9PEZI
MKRARSDPTHAMPAKRPRTGDSSRRSRLARTQQPGKGDRQELRSYNAHSRASSSASSTAGLRAKEPRLLPQRPVSRKDHSTSGHGKRQKEFREPTPASLAQRSYCSPRKFQDLAAAALRIVEQHFAIPHVQTRQRRQKHFQDRQDRDRSQSVLHRREYEPGWHLEELASHEPDSDGDEGGDAEDTDEAEPGTVYESRETDWGYTKPVVIELEESDGCSDEDGHDTPVEDRAAWLRAVRGA